MLGNDCIFCCILAFLSDWGPFLEYRIVVVHAFYIGAAPSAPVRPCLADVDLVKTLQGDLIISSSKLKLMEIVGRGGLDLLDSYDFSRHLFHCCCFLMCRGIWYCVQSTAIYGRQ